MRWSWKPLDRLELLWIQAKEEEQEERVRQAESWEEVLERKDLQQTMLAWREGVQGECGTG